MMRLTKKVPTQPCLVRDPTLSGDRPNRVQSSGFTLIEMTIAMGAFAILIGGIFALVGGTAELMDEIGDNRERQALQNRFVETMRINFEELPHDATLEFDYVDRAGSFDTYLSLVGAANAFDFGFTVQEELERVIIAAEIQRVGSVDFIRCRIYYMTEDEFRRAKEVEFGNMDQYPFVELVPRMRQLSWKFFDADARLWQPTLEGNLRSSLTEMIVRFEGDKVATRAVLWHPESR